MVRSVKTRREIIALGGLVVLSGCGNSVNERNDTVREDNISRTSTRSWEEKCSLGHRIFEEERDHYIEDTYQFSELSTLAQKYFNQTRMSEGSFEVENTQKAPPEFSYSDVVTRYKIVYGGDVFILGTVTGPGCVTDN